MRAIRLFVGTAVLGFALAGSLAAQQAAAPKDATGQCTDGSYTTAKTQAKGCLKHGGVKTWFGSATAATEAPAPKSRASVSASAPTPTSASTRSQPKDATGQCADGSYTTAKTQAKGCLKHGGVKTWYGTSAAATSASAAPAQAAAPPAAAAAPAPHPAQARPAQARAAAPAAEPAAPAQAPANPTDVWVNTATKAYHCPGTKYYGTTKHGKYMSEADARAAGFHASYGKACGS